jgi:hypothetical protein
LLKIFSVEQRNELLLLCVTRSLEQKAET